MPPPPPQKISFTHPSLAPPLENLLRGPWITDRIGQHEVLLPINHKNYNFREKRNSQIMKEREDLH